MTAITVKQCTRKEGSEKKSGLNDTGAEKKLEQALIKTTPQISKLAAFRIKHDFKKLY